MLVQRLSNGSSVQFAIYMQLANVIMLPAFAEILKPVEDFGWIQKINL